jgi:hypothetical protein
MTERAQLLMDQIYHERNTWADTETKLVAAILRKMVSHCKTYTASTMSDLKVLDTNDLLQLSKELERL